MKGVNRPLGYTIVEVMIVLAISGAMFLIAANFIAGKQAKTAFQAGSIEFTSQVQDVINQVITGKYSDVSFGCTASSSGVITMTAAGAQGTNSDCVFLAKALQIDDNADPTKYAVYTMAGTRNSPSITDTMPVIIGGGADLTSHNAVPQSLQIKDVKVIDGGVTKTGVHTIGFAQSTNAVFGSGAQTVNLVYLNPPTVVSSGVTSSFNTAQSATICITDSTRYAEVTIGDANNANQLTAVLKVLSTPC